ncbi:unnamed protein product [Dovyalis caffra]|uniref:Uncharacterized protein n=1 Tax=Dovyalis caffra TaxID=77055 RepID=A0AAV1SJI4_9ROSI|nr:unnamed protein product [Dovyalis caffra]
MGLEVVACFSWIWSFGRRGEEQYKEMAMVVRVPMVEMATMVKKIVAAKGEEDDNGGPIVGLERIYVELGGSEASGLVIMVVDGKVRVAVGWWCFVGEGFGVEHRGGDV